MFAEMPTGHVFAFAYGLYLTAAGVGFLLDRGAYAKMLDEYRNSSILTFLAAALAFLAGIVTVALHDDWSSPSAAVVSVIGWIALVKGVLGLAARRVMYALVRVLPLTPHVIVVIAAIMVPFGSWLIYTSLI